jgi:hypothetical protein
MGELLRANSLPFLNGERSKSRDVSEAKSGRRVDFA